ncbi:MAG: class I SAM-dependent methyltransferase [Proteobacteria bacterium]|nr:class I SAM-dependent methyltransferase [Pseudomonadota bacterium]
MNKLIDQILDKKWFYNFHLPEGQITESYLAKDAHAVHSTRIAMMDSVLNPRYADKWQNSTAVDLACHEGFFACHLAQKGMKVTGLEARQDHVDDANLIAKGMQLEELFQAKKVDVHDVMPEKYGRFDVVLMLGLIYHLENPVGAIRTAHSLTKDVCLIETQVAPNLSGQLDWGNHQFVKPMKGSFAIIDETHEVHGPEMSTTGICLAPSIEALVWIMQAVGFKNVQVIEPPKDAYEQHKFKKRVMVAGYKTAF